MKRPRRCAMPVTVLLMILCVAMSGGGVSASKPENSVSAAGKKRIVGDFLAKSLDRAIKLTDGKKFGKALALAGAVRALAYDSALVKSAEQVILEIENKKINYEILESELISDKIDCSAGDDIVLTVRLYNRSIKPVTIPLRYEEKRRLGVFAGKSVVPNVIQILYEATDYYVGGVSNSTWKGRDEFSEEINLEPGEFWEKNIEVKLPSDIPGRGIVRDLTISLHLTPIVYRSGKSEKVWYQYKTDSVRLRVLPRGAVTDRGNPVHSAMVALTGGDGIGLLYAIGCADRRQRAELVPSIIECMQKTTPNSPMERYLIVSLQHITGFYGRLNRRMWLAWWRDCGEDFLKSASVETGPIFLRVDVAEDGSYLIKGKKTASGEIKKILVKYPFKKRIVAAVYPSRRARWGAVLELADLLKAAGVGDIRYCSEQGKSKGGIDE